MHRHDPTVLADEERGRMTIRVLLADDHEIVRQGLRGLLEREDDIEVVAEVADGFEAVKLAGEITPHVVVMDISMAGMNGIEATRRIAAEVPQTRILCLSMHANEEFLWAALEAGAAGYMLKEGSSKELVEGIRTVMRGQKYLSPALTGTDMKGYTSQAPSGLTSKLAQLTAREREVLQLLAEGHSTKQVALRLQLSPKTIASHREHMLQKLDLDSIAGLTKNAIRHGLTTSDRMPRD